jgi:oxygen-dependent protoporphyrinogen oxidase
LAADAVVLAVPAFAAADLLADLEPPLAAALRGIRYVTSATVSLAYRRDKFNHPLNGFGFVVPAPEKRRILACTWTSTKFPHRSPPDHVLLRCFIGGARDEALAEQNDAALEAMAREELRDLLGVTATPALTRVYRWPRGNPQYDVGHLDRVAEMEALAARHPGLFLTGSAFRGIGLPDCIAQGDETAQQVLAYLQKEANPCT